MSDRLPLFPLPNVVLFPDVFLPLHVFEPRYREMVSDALAGDRLIGMVLLKPGWEPSYEDRPPVFDIGCSGVITHFERLPDGRYNIILRGLERFTILRDDHDRPYRIGCVDAVPERPLEADGLARLRTIRRRLAVLVGAETDIRERPMPPDMSDADMINALAQYLDLEPIEKQALLERNCLLSRAEALVELLDMKTLVPTTAGRSRITH
jgi:Lon protease-like protein